MGLSIDRDDIVSALENLRKIYGMLDDGVRGEIEEDAVGLLDTVLADGRIDINDAFAAIYVGSKYLSRGLRKWLNKRKERKLYKALALLIEGIAVNWARDMPGEAKLTAAIAHAKESSKWYRNLPEAEQKVVALEAKTQYEDLTNQAPAPASDDEDIEAYDATIGQLVAELDSVKNRLVAWRPSEQDVLGVVVA